MKMKSIVKLLEAQGFETYVHEAMVKKTGYTTCKKFFADCAITVTAYNDGGFNISKWDVEEWNGERRFKGTRSLESKSFDTQKELKAKLETTITEWSK